MVFLCCLSPSAQALFNSKAPTLNHLHQSPVMIALLQQISAHPELLKDADTQARLVFRDPAPNSRQDYAADLIMTDVIDQVHFYLNKKNEYALIAKLTAALGTKPLENFLKWNAVIDREAGKSKTLRRALSKVVVQLYDIEGLPMPFKLDLLRSGRFSRYERQRRAGQFAELYNNPEGKKILLYITMDRHADLNREQDLGIFPTTRPTVSKYLVHKKDFNTEYKEKFYKQYFKMIQAQENIDHEALPATAKVEFKYRFKASRAKPLLIAARFGSEKEFKSETAQLFNTIHHLPHKEALLHYLKSELETKFKVKMPAVKAFGLQHIVLTPSFIHLHRKLLIPMIKEFTYVYLYSTGDMEYFLHLRKWVRNHYEEIKKLATQKGLPFTIPDRGIFLPHVTEVVENFSIMMQIYPDHPWDQKLPVIYDSKGNPVYLKGAGLRMILKARDFLKKLVSIENVSSLVVGGLVYAATGNPMLSSMAGSLVRDAVTAIKYDIKFKDILPSMLRNVAVAAILGSGFSPGRVAEQIILGGLAGAAEAVAINRRVDVGAIVGAIQGMVLGLLPRSIAHPTLAGLTKDVYFKNALIELLETSVYRGVNGLIVSVVTKEDMLEGMGKGLIYGLGEAGLKIAIYGYRYKPVVTSEELRLENQFQNSEGVGVGNYNIDQLMVDDTFFRTGGIIQMFYDRPFTFGNQILMNDSNTGDSDTEAHEMSHRAQNRTFGIIGFNTRYVMEFFKRGSHGTAEGGNVFENYRFLNSTHPDAALALDPLIGTPVGMQAIEGTIGTTGGSVGSLTP